MELIHCTYHISLTAKRGILRGQLIDDDVDGQRQKHHDHAHHQDALGACPSWADLVHLSKKLSQHYTCCSVNDMMFLLGWASGVNPFA